jgi:hypothetical protein
LASAWTAKAVSLTLGQKITCAPPPSSTILLEQSPRWAEVRKLRTAEVADGSAAPVRSLQQQAFIRTPVLTGPHEP